MMTIEQERQITEYLLSKRLYSGLLLEIKDHFILQIQDLALQNNLSFHEAFLRVKLNWQDELQMIKADIFSFKKITRLEKKILQYRFRNITITSFLFSFFILGFLWISPTILIYIQMTLLGVLIYLLVYNFASIKMKFFDYCQLSFHPLIVRNALLGLVLLSA